MNQFEDDLTRRNLEVEVLMHATRYGGLALHRQVSPLVVVAPTNNLYRALDAFVPDTIIKALDPPKAYSKEKFTDE